MLKKAFYTFGTSLLTAISNFLVIMLLTKWFGAVGMAEIGIFLFACMLIAVLNAVFGSTSIVYLYPRHNFDAIFVVSTSWAIFSAALSVFVAYVFKLYTDHLPWLFIISSLQSFYINNLSFVLAQNNIKKYNALRIVQPVLLLLSLCCGFFITSINYNTYFLLMSVSYLFSTLRILYFVPKIKLSGLKIAEMKGVVKSFFVFGGLSQLTNLLQFLNYRVSYVFIGLFCTKADVGLMVLAMTFVDGIWLFKNNVSTLKYVETSLDKTAKANNLKMTALCILITLGILLGVLLMPNQTYTYLFGEDFFRLKELLLLMSPGIMAMAASSVFANYFSGLGKVHINFYVAVVGLGTFVPSIYFLCRYYGLYGAAVANNVPLIVGSLIVFYYYFSFKSQRD